MTAKTSPQHKGSEQLPSIFYRKVIRTKTGRLLNLTPAIPKDWRYVTVKAGIYNGKYLTLLIEKLAGDNNNESKNIEKSAR